VIASNLAAADGPARLAEPAALPDSNPRSLFNNAALRSARRAAELDRAKQLAIIDLNIRALTTCRCLARQHYRNRGGILNVASIAGFLPGPGMAV